MPKHALDRATIAELILSQISPDAQAQHAQTQLFLLNFERLILQDFSRYETHGEFERKPADARISDEYLSIIEQLMAAELSADQVKRLKNLLSALNEASPEDASELACAQSVDVSGLFRFFPQNCFAYIGGAFFEAFLNGHRDVRGFDKKRQVFFGRVKELRSLYATDSPRYSELSYTQDCGRLVSWLNDPFVPAKEWLYVAPVICDGSFFGLLYRFSDGENKTVVKELTDALTEAETLFRDMRYALIADVAERIGRLEDPLDVFLAELPNYQNVALAANWSEGRDPVVYGRTFVKGVESNQLQPLERQLAWQVIPAAYIYSQEEIIERERELSTLSSSIADSWVEVTKDDKQVEIISLNRAGVRRLFRKEVVRAYEEAGLSLRYGVVIPGKFIRSDYNSRHLELYFFEPVEANIKRGKRRFTRGIRRKLYSLIPLLQEIAVLESSAEEQARKLNQIIASLVFHEVKNSLSRKTGATGNGIPVWLHNHVNRCLDAYGKLEIKPCSRGDWEEVSEWLQTYWSFYIKKKINLREWPTDLAPIKLSKELIYVIACELILNAITVRAQSIDVALTYEPTVRAAALSITNDGAIDFSRLELNLDDYWKAGITTRDRYGLALIMQLLRVLHSTHYPPIKASRVNGFVRISCYLALAS